MNDCYAANSCTQCPNGTYADTCTGVNAASLFGPFTCSAGTPSCGGPWNNLTYCRDCTAGSDGGGTQLATQPGKPEPGAACEAPNRELSLRISDVIAIVNSNNSPAGRSVTDVSMVFGNGSTQIINNQKVIIKGQFAGFLYYDDNGGFWFQKANDITWGVSVDVGVTLFNWLNLGVSFTPPSQNVPVYVGDANAVAKLQDGRHVVGVKCWDGSGSYFPWTLG